MQPQRMLVMLDALIDTRIATVSLLNPDAAAALFNDPKMPYWRRTDDNFEKLTKGVLRQDEYLKAYKARDIETLKHSQLTSMTVLLSGMIGSLDKLRLNTPLVGKAEIELNVWPYRLTDEQKAMYETCITAYAGMETPVKTVEIPIAAITPEQIKSRWEAVMLYDLDEWVCEHLGSLTVNKIPRQTMIAPARSANQSVDPEELMRQGVEVHPFALLEGAMSSMIGLDLLEMQYFCAIPPKW